MIGFLWLEIKGYSEEVTSKKVVFYQEKMFQSMLNYAMKQQKNVIKKNEKFTKNLKLVI